jgi:hypothetical protein
MNATTPQERQPQCCTDRTPREHCLDTRKLAEGLAERDLRRSVHKGLAQASAQWDLKL